MQPYYQDELATIYHGDCRELLGQLDQPDTCIVDPVWPNSVFAGVLDPAGLFAEMAEQLTTDRLVVQLGCMSDPRFLAGVPARYPVLRVCWLRYAHPSYVGRILMGSDVAYAFGAAPRSRPGRQLLSGETTARNNATKLQHTGRGNGTTELVEYDDLPHPAPRRLEHVSWLCNVFADAGVIDPFMGTGTTLEAAKSMGLRAVGIEIEERYCEIAASRLAQTTLGLSFFEPSAVRTAVQDALPVGEDAA